MTLEIVPVICPRCGESQNLLPGQFNPDATPFGPVSCMICQRPFTQAEYYIGLEKQLSYLKTLTGPSEEN